MALAGAILLLGDDMTSRVPFGSVQAVVDSAKGGSVVSVPAGTYTGQVSLKDGIMLIGTGAHLTFLDGACAECVVKGGANSALVGFSIRNGRGGRYPGRGDPTCPPCPSCRTNFR